MAGPNKDKFKIVRGQLVSYSGDNPTVEIPGKVRRIQGAFRGNETVRRLIMPDSVTAVGEESFSGSKIRNVILSSALSEIGDRAFFGCTALESAEFPDALSSLGDFAYAGCKALTSVLFGGGIKKLGRGCFSDSALISVQLPDSIENMGEGCFAGCSLRSVSLPENLKEIAAGAFYDCRSLRSLRLPYGLSCVGDGAFYNCALLPEEIKQRLLSINPRCMSAAEGKDDYFDSPPLNLKKDKAESGAAQKGESAAGGEAALLENAASGAEPGEETQPVASCLTEDGQTGADKVSGRTGLGALQEDELSQEDEEAWYEEDEEDERADENGFIVEDGVLVGYTGDASTLEIPDGVTEIGEFVFQNNDCVEIVLLPATVRKIGVAAFRNSFLKEIYFPDTLKEIGAAAFRGCWNLFEITFPAGLERIGRNAFSDSSVLEALLPEGLKELGPFCFSFTRIDRALLPASLTSISEGVFYKCEKLADINLPPLLNNVGDHAFAGCDLLPKDKADKLLAVNPMCTLPCPAADEDEECWEDECFGPDTDTEAPDAGSSSGVKVKNIMPDAALESCTEKDETVLVSGKPDKKTYLKKAMLNEMALPAAIFFCFDFIAVSILMKFGVFANYPFLIFFFVLHLLPLWIWLHGIIKKVRQYKSTQYLLTDRRVMYKAGNKVGIVNLSDVKAVACTDSASKICGVKFFLVKGGDYTIEAVDNGTEFAGRVAELLKKDEESKDKK